MNQSPAQQWSALSALYERADGLDAPALAVWLAQLERERNPLLPQLRRMLAARAQFETNDFLGTLPKLVGADPKPVPVWAEGKLVGAYRLLRPLGEGGMAEVWLAERTDGAIKRRVAIKLPYPRPGRETFAIRFDRERDILATLRHPNIAGLYDAGVTADGQAWLALEYVDGEPLSTWCDQQRLGLRERVTLFRQVLLAVQHAHANLVIHRDLKPANILVTTHGEVRLLDFGIAKLLEAEGDAMPETELTRQAGRTLTPRYASPEQITGVPLTTASDVYSLGVVFYELISGARPYELKVESAAQLEHAILETEPRAPSRHALSEDHAQVRGGLSVKALRRALAPELDAIALRCLGKLTSARYSSVDAVIADVDRWLNGEAVLARAPGAWYRFGKFAARHRIGVGLGAAAVLSLIAVATVAIVMGVQARDESARAVAARDFMLNIFKRADQEKSRGADITARDLLETGRKDVLTRLAGQPRLQAELLQGIGDIQRDMGEFASAGGTYGEAASLYSQLRMPRESALAYTKLADATLNQGDLKQAQALLGQARGVHDRPLEDAELNALLNEVQGWIADGLGDPLSAKNSFLEAQGFALRAFGPDHPKSLAPLAGLISAERQLRHFDAALQQQAELERLSSRTLGRSPKDMAQLDEGRIELLYAAGRYAQGLPDAVAALARCEQAQLPFEEYCRRLRMHKLRFALRLGSIDSIQGDYPFVEKLADDSRSPQGQVEALGMLLRIESARGASPRQRDYLLRLQALCEASPSTPLDPTFKLLATLAVAEDRLRSQAGQDAAEWLARAGAQLSDMGASAPPSLRAVSMLLRGVAQLQGSQWPQAAESLSAANATIAAAVGPEHPLSRLFSLNLAVALNALGKTEEALSLALAAEPVLRQSLGKESAAYRRVQRLTEALRRGAVSVPEGGASRTLATLDFFT